jgi:two-component system OmpR family response regulator
MHGVPLNSILYVEDDLDIQALVTLVLRSLGGFEVMACSSGSEALAAAEKLMPDLLLLDVMMPGRDGLATLSALRKLPNTMRTPAIFMTTKVRPSEVSHYHSVGAIGVIAKPFESMQLVQQVRRLWEEHTAGQAGAPSDNSA